jgi:glycosyltransferase involved in cell wall biosynthesis
MSKPDKAMASESWSSRENQTTCKLLVLDAAWSLEAIRERGLEHSITCRDLDGFFEHVWSVHPFATLVTSDTWSDRFGRPVTTKISPRHTFIEGKIGRYNVLRKLAPLNFLLSQIGIFRDLYRLVRAQEISVIRAGDPLYLGLFGLALSRLCAIPLVIRIGANNNKLRQTKGGPMMPRLFFSCRIEEAVERFVLKRTDLVAGVNQDNLNFALTSGARPEYSTVFRYGNLIDKRHLAEPSERRAGQQMCDELGVTQSNFVLFIGRLTPEKHPDDVVRALAEVRKRQHDIKLLMVGDGPRRAEIVELAHELGVQDHVVFCGNMDQGWLSKMIPMAAAVLSPITGRALSEVAFGAAPIVAYDTDWQRELIETGVTGELVPHRSWIEMADALERFLNEPAYARAMGEAARKRALEMLDPDVLDQHERDQYLALLKWFEGRRNRRAKGARAAHRTGT